MTIYLLTQGQGNILIRRCVSEYQHIMCYSISLHNYFVPIVQISPASCKLDLNICKTITEPEQLSHITQTSNKCI